MNELIDPVADAGALRQRVAELEQQLEAARTEFSRFSGRLAHDLQAILQNISGFTRVLQDTALAKLSDSEARYLSRVRSGASQGEALLRELRALSGIAVAEIHPQSVDVARLVRESIRDLEPAAEGRMVEWEVKVGDDEAQVVADPAILKLAVDHLAANALKFTRGKSPARIRVSAGSHDGDWRLCVRDNGAGFDLQYQHRLFVAFERLHSTSEFEGNGLGLAIVGAAADRHGGRVEAQTWPEGGAEFTLILPARAQVQAPSVAQRAPAPDGARAPHVLRVLVVDDEPLVLATLKAMLEREGHEVTTAAGGPAGCQALGEAAAQASPFDLVISDWLMPDISGPQLAHAARQLSPATRVILLTGQRTGADGQHAVPPHADQVLAKPLRASDLRAALAESRTAGSNGS